MARTDAPDGRRVDARASRLHKRDSGKADENATPKSR